MTWRNMTAQQARDHLARLELFQTDAARIFGVNPKTFRRYLSLSDPQAIPPAIALALELLSKARAQRLLEDLR